jgi:hypothetical protein
VANWRNSMSRVRIFPIATGGVSYSFNTPWQLRRTLTTRF